MPTQIPEEPIINMKFLNKFYFHRYRINLRPRDVLRLPAFKGSALRGKFGHALKAAVCTLKREDCKGCLLQAQCIYPRVMEPRLPENHSMARKYNPAPCPYILEPPPEGRRYFTKAGLISFDLVLIGDSLEYIPYFIYAFINMGRPSKQKSASVKEEDYSAFDLETVESIDLHGNSACVYSSQEELIHPHDNRIEATALNMPEDCGQKEVRLCLESPLRLKEHALLADEIPFKLFVSRLYERALLLSHLYCGTPLEETTGLLEKAGQIEIIANSLVWQPVKRYSNKQNAAMRFDGLLGEITYAGALGEYMPLLRLGEQIHLGKNTTIGLGKYRITDTKLQKIICHSQK